MKLFSFEIKIVDAIDKNCATVEYNIHELQKV